MNVEIDPNQDDENCIMELTDERFFLVVFIPKSEFASRIAAIQSMAVEDEVLLGVLGSGPRVWLIRDDAQLYAIAVGDTDSKDVSYTLPNGALTAICNASPGF